MPELPAKPAQRPEAVPRFVSRVYAVRNRLLFRRRLGSLISLLGLAAALLLGVNGLDRLLSLRETTALVLTAAGAAGAAVFFLTVFVRSWFRRPRGVDIALAAERLWPELMDTFVCAVEIYENKSAENEELRPLERLVLSRAEGMTAELPLESRILPRQYRVGRMLARAGLFLLLAGLGLRGTGARKAYYGFLERYAGGAPGLVVQPGDVDAPEGADVTVLAFIRRWDKRARVRILAPDGRRCFPMTPGRKTDAFRFTFYGVSGAFRYRIETPALVSRYFTVTTYRPPALRGTEIRITPPEYTGKKPRTLSDLEDLAAVTGSRVRFQFHTARAVRATLEWLGRELALPAGADGIYAATTRITGSGRFRVRLRDSQGHGFCSSWFSVTAIPDQPPVVEVIEPHHDTEVTARGTVSTLARAVDDFGVTELRVTWSISGGPRRSEPVFQAGMGKKTAGERPPREHDGRRLFDMARLRAREGDVIAYFYTARDNRSPKPQESRSQVYFIEVRPDLKSVKQKGGGQKKKLDLTPLIAESKRLIRASWDALGRAAAERAKATRSLASAMHDLRVSASRLFQRIQAGGGDSAGTAAASVLQPMRAAERMLEAGVLEESIPPQERALARLVALENQLMKNAMAQGRGGKNKGKSRNESGKKQGNGKDRAALSQAAKLRVLRKAAEELRRLVAAQSRLNQRVRRALPADTPALAGPQQGIWNDTDRVTRILGAVPEAAAAAGDAGMAAKEMTQGTNALAAAQAGKALRHGLRARVHLDAALREVEAAYKQIAAGQIQRLAAAAAQLSQDQRSAAAASRKLGDRRFAPGDPRLRKLQHQQAALGKQTRRLLQAARQTAAALEETAPKAAGAVAAAADQAEKDGLARGQKRAENALRYQRFERAAHYQTTAANRLLQLAGNLRKAGGLLPAMTPSEIRAVLRDVREAALRAAQAGRSGRPDALQTLRNIRNRSAGELGRTAAALHDNALETMAEDLSLPIDGGNPRAAGARTAGVLQAAAAVLEKHLAAGTVRARAGLYREAAEAPARYRRLVEEYFRDLSESQ